MKQRVFMDMLDLAWQDFQSADAQTAVGLVAIVIHRNDDDQMDIQMGANVAPEVVRYALTSLVRSWQRGENGFTEVKPKPLRKIV